MSRPYPRAGAQYPSSLGEFQAWFQTDADCLDYLGSPHQKGIYVR